MKTRTGNFPIGFRKGGSDWQKDLDGMIVWAKQADFEVIDLGSDADETAAKVVAAGLRVGSADLRKFKDLISPDKAKRDAAVQINREYIQKAAAAGVSNFFTVMLPEDAARDRKENFADMVDAYSQLATVCDAVDAKIVVEGWPGPGALCCTPEGYAALYEQIPSPAMGVNYDPSHLIRMGIDPLRFLHDFADRVYHVHGKDTELLTEELYAYGNTQPTTFATTPAFGGPNWRYTIPGHGCMRWTKAFELLRDASYAGCVSIELEDANFNGTEDGEKQGLTWSGTFLASF